jgi:hypothetical protein
MAANFKSYSDYNGTTVELGYGYHTMKNAEFAARFPGVKGIRCDSFTMYVGTVSNMSGAGRDPANLLPVTRRIEYKRNPSLHECNAKCMNGSHRGACECRCGGKNHGVGKLSCESVK